MRTEGSLKENVVKRMVLQHATTDPAIESIQAALRLSQDALARMLDLSVRTIVRWEGGEGPPSLERERLELISEVVEIAKDIMKPEDLPIWFSSPKEAFSDRRPLDLLSSFKEIQQMRDLLEKTRWGIF